MLRTHTRWGVCSRGVRGEGRAGRLRGHQAGNRLHGSRALGGGGVRGFSGVSMKSLFTLKIFQNQIKQQFCRIV